MILIDLHQVIISSIMVSVKTSVIDESFLRHVTLNVIRAHKKKYGHDYGELVICSDSYDSWRKEFFPNYKAHRKANRDKSLHDWNFIFTTINKIREELKQYFPYKVLSVTGAEADDIIATMIQTHAADKHIIISSDKDFIQLQNSYQVEQYSPILKKLISSDSPKHFLREHIIRGDRGDGVPNMLSSDNCFIAGERQTVLTAGRMAEYMAKTELELMQIPGYCRNRKLIDLSFIPSEVKEKIIAEYAKDATAKNFKIMQEYFMTHDLRNLYGVIHEF